jgi:DNA-binding IclR family transcriptional regulator
MAYTYEQLKERTVAQLREVAADLQHEALQGYTQLNKEHLLVALCKALGIEMHAHHEIKGLNKSEIKAQIRELKKKRNEALTAHDRQQLKQVRREIHHLKHMIHRATV